MIDLQAPNINGSNDHDRLNQVVNYIDLLHRQIELGAFDTKTSTEGFSQTDSGIYAPKKYVDELYVKKNQGSENVNMILKVDENGLLSLARLSPGGDDYTEIASNSTASLFTASEIYQMYQDGVKMKYMGDVIHYADVTIDYDDNVTSIRMSRYPYGAKVHQYVYYDTLYLDVIQINSSKVISVSGKYDLSANGATFAGAVSAYSLTARSLSGNGTPSTTTPSLELSASGFRAQLGIKSSNNNLFSRLYLYRNYISIWDSDGEKSQFYPSWLRIPEVSLNKISTHTYGYIEFGGCGLFLHPEHLLFNEYGLVAQGTYGRFLITYDRVTFPGSRWIKIQRQMVTARSGETSIAATLKIDFENQSITWE